MIYCEQRDFTDKILILSKEGRLLVELLNIIMAMVSIILGITSIGISLKARNESNKINQETEKKLIEIKNLSDNITKTSERIENNIKTQIDRIINSNVPTQDEKMQQQLMETLLPELVKKPETLFKLAELTKKD